MTQNTTEAQSDPIQPQPPQTANDSVRDHSQIVKIGAEISNILTLAQDNLKKIEDEKTKIDVISSSIGEAKTDIEEARKTVSTRRKKIEGLMEAVETKLGEAQKDQETFTHSYGELESRKEAAQKELEETETIKTNIETLKTQIESVLEMASKNKDQIAGIETQTTDFKKSAESNLKDILEKSNEIKQLHEKTLENYSELFKDNTDAEGKRTPCIQNQIKELLEALESDRDDSTKAHEQTISELQKTKQTFEEKIGDIEKQHNTKLEEIITTSKTSIETLKHSLETDIRALLPDAGAAGLANTYFDAKARYSFVPYASNSKTKHPILGFLVHLLQGTVPSLFFYAMFLTPLIYIIVFFSPILTDLQQGKPIDQTIIIFKTILSIPLGAISLFGWSSIRVNRMLYEEYNHKQRVMQLYRSFKDEIETLDDDSETKDALIKIMLKAVNDKPSLKMHKYDKPLEISIPNIDPFAMLKKATQAKPVSGD